MSTQYTYRYLIAAPLTIWTVYKPNTNQASSNLRICGFFGTNISKFQWESSGLKFYVGSFLSTYALGLTAGQASVLVGVYDGSQVTLYFNGVAQTPGAASLTVTSNPFQWGNQNVANGWYHEMGVVLSGLSATDASQLSRYLGTKWGVSVS